MKVRIKSSWSYLSFTLQHPTGDPPTNHKGLTCSTLTNLGYTAKYLQQHDIRGKDESEIPQASSKKDTQDCVDPTTCHASLARPLFRVLQKQSPANTFR